MWNITTIKTHALDRAAQRWNADITVAMINKALIMAKVAGQDGNGNTKFAVKTPTGKTATLVIDTKTKTLITVW